jgi:LuxR family maltose regulon positive regulatory protein
MQETRGLINRISASAHLQLGEVLYKTNALDEAYHHLQMGVDMSHQLDIPEGAALGLLWMATIRQAQSAEEAAQDLRDQAVPLVEHVQPPMAISLLDTLVTRLALMQGKLDSEVARWADEQEAALEQKAPDAGLIQRRLELLTLSRVWIEQQRWDEAKDLLDHLARVLRETGHLDYLIEALALEAIVRDACGNQQSTVESLNQALALAKAEDYVRTFIDLGDPMRVLMQKTMAQLVEQDYAQKLVMAFRNSTASPSTSIDPRSETLLEPLNELELAILRLVAVGLTNPEIASKRFVTVNTVKWHLKNIYGKLGVHSRVAAVNRARDLDLL